MEHGRTVDCQFCGEKFIAKSVLKIHYLEGQFSWRGGRPINRRVTLLHFLSKSQKAKFSPIKIDILSIKIDILSNVRHFDATATQKVGNLLCCPFITRHYIVRHFSFRQLGFRHRNVPPYGQLVFGSAFLSKSNTWNVKILNANFKTALIPLP
jgi:hypothetical protein